ncbi:MAG: hypothetical protein DYH13_11145 [Alphaproteobacteria bacterium PRO2]|nr:hypothetical protein [Alphaproteobacteria bacterium PRO2]
MTLLFFPMPDNKISFFIIWKNMPVNDYSMRQGQLFTGPEQDWNLDAAIRVRVVRRYAHPASHAGELYAP